MAKPNVQQIRFLEDLRLFVIEVMSSFDIWSKEQLTSLSYVKLGVLRKNATQRHGVTRWKRGVKAPKHIHEVDVVDLHPRLLFEDWKPYAAWVLHHEFVHALGYFAHDSAFRTLEQLWPSKKSSKMGYKFTEMLRREKATWLWVCPKCKKEFPRQKQGNGRYMCKNCKCALDDVPMTASQ
tara:strand:- start:18527 stop:19066 length:540 start_codon:yes stop_codon:yes gene_type:complete